MNRKNTNKFSLANYSLITQIIIINLLTAIVAFIFLILFNYFLLSNNESLNNQINKIKSDLYQITTHLSEKSVIRVAQFQVETCLRSKDHQIVIAPKCLEDNKRTYEENLFSAASDLQLDPTFTQEYILDNYLNKTTSVKIYDDTWAKFVDTENVYVHEDVVEVDVNKDILESSNNLGFYLDYKNNYLKYFKNLQKYFDRSKIDLQINKYRQEIILVKETIMSQKNLSYLYEDESKNIIMVNSSPIVKNNNIYGVVIISDILNNPSKEIGLVSFNLINLFIIIIFAMFSLSLLFSQSIVSPIKTLSKIVRSERDKANKNGDKIIYPKRRDEIGILSNDIKSMSRDLKSQINELENFAADVSHELKNPLSNLKTSNELLAENKINTEEKKLLFQNIANDLDRMNKLISDISDFTRTQAEIEKQKYQEFNLVNFINDLKLSLSQNKKNIKILYESKETDIIVQTNLNKLAQVFINIIENAVSFSPEKSNVKIFQNKQNDKVVIYIIDQGSGINKQQKEKIFDRFYTDRGKKNEYHTGLGLSIAKRIMQSLSGSLELSDKNIVGYKGACFKIELPIKG